MTETEYGMGEEPREEAVKAAENWRYDAEGGEVPPS